MTCQRRGLGLACILLAALCAGLSPIGTRAATGVAARSNATATAASGATTTASGGTPGTPASPAPLPPLPLSPEAVLAHLKKTLDWYHESQNLQQVPQLATDVVERDSLRQTALSVLSLAFRFGHAAAAQIAPTPAGTAGEGAGAGATSGESGRPRVSGTPGPPSIASASSATASSSASSAASGGNAPAAAQRSQQSLAQASARIASRTMQLQAQVADLDARLARAPARSRKALRAQRDQVAAALALEREVQTTIGELQQFQSSLPSLQGSGAKDLLGQVTDLERTVPELRQGGLGTAGTAGAAPSAVKQSGAASGAAASGAATAAGGAAQAANFHAESAGIIALISEWISLQSTDGHLSNMLKSTDALGKSLDAVRSPIIAQARTLAREDTNGVDSSDPAELEVSRRMLEAAAARFKQLAAVLVPLGDQAFALDSARATLTNWRGALRARIAVVAWNLVVRLAILGALILAVLVVSEVWRRAAFKYLRDARRRSQFQTLRRVIIGILLAVVILFALVEQLGSLATYVGFVTAGLAVALQNVILSIVGYFFLIGRYGVRVGDRITLAGVTGRVVDIGLIRIYLMELAGADLHSTGRVVVLSNSVLFQPQALFKQIPGADFLWHTIALTLAPTVDVQAAQQQLKSTADEVFEQYRASIEAQHAAVRQQIDFDTAAPCPEVRVRFAEHGWQFEVRYPVRAEQAARIDERMLKAIRSAVADAEHFPVADSGTPVLKAEALGA